VVLPDGVVFDPGGIGKGLAADLVAAALLDAGADGACVNLGGDVRAEGSAPGGTWRVAVSHPGAAEPVALVALAAGAVATSTTALRTWGPGVHHLVDPATGRPYAGPLATVTAVAREAAWAEVAAKAALLGDGVRTLDALGTDGLVRTAAGEVTATPGLAAYRAA
jgi:thiamine biosynthesis lipoprotein